MTQVMNMETLRSPVRLAIVGLGFVSRIHAESLLLSSVPAIISAACDRSEEALSLFQSSFKVGKTYVNHQQLIDEGDYDCAIICVPNSLHSSIVHDFLRQNKPILIEKPLAGTLTDANTLLKEVSRHNTPVFVADQMCFTPAMNTLKRYLTEECSDDEFYQVRHLCRIDLPYSRSTAWYRDVSVAGGGALLDTGSHGLQVCSWLLDIDEYQSSFGVQYLRDDAGDSVIDEYSEIFAINYRRRLQMICSMSRLHVGPEETALEISGRRVYIRYSSLEPSIICVYRTNQSVRHINVPVGADDTYHKTEGFVQQISAFLSLAALGGRMPISVPLAHEAVRCTANAYNNVRSEFSLRVQNVK